MSEIIVDEGETIIFPSGARAYAHMGIIGIDEDGEIFGGYDQRFQTSWNPEEAVPLSQEDRLALGKFMIERWTRWMNQEGKERVG